MIFYHAKNLVKNLQRTISIIPIHYRHASTNYKSDSLELAYNSYESTNTYSEDNPAPIPLIILHGLLGSKNNWNTTSKKLHLHTKAKVLAVDARNHGDSPHYREHNYDSMVVDLKNFMDSMALRRVNLLGHSMGGRTAMLFALKYVNILCVFFLCNL